MNAFQDLMQQLGDALGDVSRVESGSTSSLEFWRERALELRSADLVEPMAVSPEHVARLERVAERHGLPEVESWTEVVALARGLFAETATPIEAFRAACAATRTWWYGLVEASGTVSVTRPVLALSEAQATELLAACWDLPKNSHDLRVRGPSLRGEVAVLRQLSRSGEGVLVSALGAATGLPWSVVNRVLSLAAERGDVAIQTDLSICAGRSPGLPEDRQHDIARLRTGADRAVVACAVVERTVAEVDFDGTVRVLGASGSLGRWRGHTMTVRPALPAGTHLALEQRLREEMRQRDWWPLLEVDEGLFVGLKVRASTYAAAAKALDQAGHKGRWVGIVARELAGLPRLLAWRTHKWEAQPTTLRPECETNLDRVHRALARGPASPERLASAVAMPAERVVAALAELFALGLAQPQEAP